MGDSRWGQREEEASWPSGKVAFLSRLFTNPHQPERFCRQTEALGTLSRPSCAAKWRARPSGFGGSDMDF